MNPKLKTAITLGVISLIVALATYILAIARLGDSTAFERLDAPLQDALVRLRNSTMDQPVTDAITLIGIDDQTVSSRGFGRFGQGIWRPRQPFIMQLAKLQELQPKVVGYDIIIKENQGESSWNENLYAHDMSIDELLEAVKNADANTDKSRFLNPLTNFVTEHADELLNTAMQEFLLNADNTRLLFACSYYDEGGKTWAAKDILGADPSVGTEDDGKDLPYIRDVRIPMDYVSGDLSDMRFYETVPNLPTNRILDAGYLAYINGSPDADGVRRRYPLVKGVTYSFQDSETGKKIERRFLVPSMGLLSTLFYLGIDIRDMNWNDG